jgi:hypothetical protein
MHRTAHCGRDFGSHLLHTQSLGIDTPYAVAITLAIVYYQNELIRAADK